MLSKSAGLIILLGIYSIQNIHAQDNEKRYRGWLVEVHYANRYFFDTMPIYFNYPLISSGGINVSYFTKTAKNGFQLAAESFFRTYPKKNPSDRVPGELEERHFYLLSLAYLHPLIKGKRTNLWFLANATYRYGSEMIHLSFPQWYEEKVITRDQADWGGSAGIKYLYKLPYNFTVSTEAKYTRFLYIKHKPDLAQHPFDKGSNKQFITIQLQVGYRF
jgi:hypothetical protein